MNRIGKGFAVFFILIMAISSLSLILIKPAEAQTLPAPNFSVKLIYGSYKLPTTYSTDPYTGATITNGGNTVQYRNLTLTITNVPNANWYLLEYKGHYDTKWTSLYTGGSNVTIHASSGSQTLLVFFSSDSGIADPFSYTIDGMPGRFAPGDKIDFRIMAIDGSPWISPLQGANYVYETGPSSSWSNVQTFDVPTSNSASISQSPTLTSTPTVPELPVLLILPFFVSVFLVAVYFKHRRTNHE